MAVLDPDVVFHADRAAGPTPSPVTLRGARSVATGASAVERVRFTRPALVNGRPGLVMAPYGRLFLALAFTVEDGRITEIDTIADPDRVAGPELAVLDI